MKATLMSFMLFIESHPVSCMPIAHAHVLTAPCTMHFSFAWHENDALENQLIFLRLVLWSTALLRIGQRPKA